MSIFTRIAQASNVIFHNDIAYVAPENDPIWDRLKAVPASTKDALVDGAVATASVIGARAIVSAHAIANGVVATKEGIQAIPRLRITVKTVAKKRGRPIGSRNKTNDLTKKDLDLLDEIINS